MKKYVCTLMVILLLASAMGTVTAKNQEYSYLAVLTRYTDYTVNGELEQQGFVDTGRLDLSRVVTAYVFSTSRPIPLVLPDGSGWEEGIDIIGARVTFDKPFDIFLAHNSLEVVQIPGNAILEPKRVEIVGNIAYGVIVEIGDDYVVLDARDENARPTGTLTRYTITSDTLMWYEATPFEAGSGCEMIVASEGVVCSMQEGNG